MRSIFKSSASYKKCHFLALISLFSSARVCTINNRNNHFPWQSYFFQWAKLIQALWFKGVLLKFLHAWSKLSLQQYPPFLILRNWPGGGESTSLFADRTYTLLVRNKVRHGKKSPKIAVQFFIAPSGKVNKIEVNKIDFWGLSKHSRLSLCTGCSSIIGKDFHNFTGFAP